MLVESHEDPPVGNEAGGAEGSHTNSEEAKVGSIGLVCLCQRIEDGQVDDQTIEDSSEEYLTKNEVGVALSSICDTNAVKMRVLEERVRVWVVPSLVLEINVVGLPALGKFNILSGSSLGVRQLDILNKFIIFFVGIIIHGVPHDRQRSHGDVEDLVDGLIIGCLS